LNYTDATDALKHAWNQSQKRKALLVEALEYLLEDVPSSLEEDPLDDLIRRIRENLEAY
jgi:hypothetical protein